LTLAIAASGSVLDLRSLPETTLDKHSTGGVGDKTTLILLPLWAAAGLTVVKLSGAGLGITGGTIDKCHSIPGFRTDLTKQEMIEQARRIGISLAAASADLAPADKRLYTLRDVTATVDELGLITSSILAKKLAAGCKNLVLDVKSGSGGFMKDDQSATRLAETLVQTGKAAGMKVVAVISDMDYPLGTAVGNALEVREAIQFLHPGGAKSGDPRLGEVVFALWKSGLRMFGMNATEETFVQLLESGQALEKFYEWAVAQGASPKIREGFDWLPAAPVQAPIFSESEGYLQPGSAEVFGEVVRDLGGGRLHPGAEVDPAVGVELAILPGERIEKGQLLCTVHAQSELQVKQSANYINERLRFSHQKPLDRGPVLAEI
jgi:pyrimidine-nucleoside phosphorylase